MRNVHTHAHYQITSFVVFEEQQAHNEWMIKYLDFVTFSMCHEVHIWVFKPCCTTWEIYWTPSESTLNFTELPGFVEVQIRVLPGPAEVYYVPSGSWLSKCL